MNRDNENEHHQPKISKAEKEALKAKIYRSVVRAKVKKKQKRWVLAAAASITVIIGLGLYFKEAPDQNIMEFVNESRAKPVPYVEEVTLMLNENKNVKVDAASPQISYSAAGTQINIGNQVIQQAAEQNNTLAYNTLLVPYGRRTTIQLSDGTQVWLNSGSKLVYPAIFKGANRSVYLEGEAIFEVTHNKSKPFQVLTKDQEIAVLGTVFNVNSYTTESVTQTVLKSGSIQISYQNKQTEKLLIAPGTMAELNNKTRQMNARQVDVERYFSWRDGVLKLKNDNLRLIMAKLSRYYNVDISIQDQKLANQTFSGELDLKEDIEQVLKLIEQTTAMTFVKMDNNEILIKNLVPMKQ